MRRVTLVSGLVLAAFASIVGAQETTNPLTKAQLQSAAFTLNIQGTWQWKGGACPPASTSCDAAAEARQAWVCNDTASRGVVYTCPAGDGWVKNDIGTDPGITTYNVGTGQTYARACGRACSDPNGACVSGTALFDALPVTAGQTKKIAWAPGTYSDPNDCLQLGPDKVAATGTLILEGPPGDLAMIRPTVTTQASIDGGLVIGFGRGGSTTDGTLLIRDLGFHSDDTCLTAVECPAIAVGEKNGTTETATNAAGWTRFEYTGGKVRAGGQGILIQASFAADGIWPTWKVGDGADVIGAQAGVDPQGLYIGVIENARGVHADTSFCDTCTAVPGGAVQSGSTTTAVILESSAPLSTAQNLEGQALTLAGSGSCTAAGQTRDILSYATRTATVSRAFTNVVDPNCTYTVAARDGCERKDACRDFDWTTAAGSGSFDNIAAVYARGDGASTTTSNNTGSSLTIRNTPLSYRVTSHGDSAGKKAKIIDKFQILDRITLQDVQGVSLFGYEQTAATCASSSNAIWGAFLNDNEETVMQDVSFDATYQGANCGTFGVGLGSSATEFHFTGVSTAINRASTVNGLTYTAGHFDYDIPSASVTFSVSSLTTSNRALRTLRVPAPLANSALGGWNSAPTGLGKAFHTLGADPGTGGTYAATSNPTAGKCWLYPITVPAELTMNTAHFIDDAATTDAGADGAFCLWTPDCQQRIAGWESVDFEDADGQVTLANFLDGETQGRRIIAPGQYYFGACFENGTSTLMGINDPTMPMVGAQSSAFTISNCTSNACRCPTTCTSTTAANVGPDRPLVWIRE